MRYDEIEKEYRKRCDELTAKFFNKAETRIRELLQELDNRFVLKEVIIGEDAWWLVTGMFYSQPPEDLQSILSYISVNQCSPLDGITQEDLSRLFEITEILNWMEVNCPVRGMTISMSQPKKADERPENA